MKIIKRYALYIFAIFALTAFINTHDYYVSVTKVEYSKKDKAIQVISQIFIDDFEKVLRQRYDKGITLVQKNESKVIETYMAKYLSHKLNFKINNKDVNYTFLGKEYKDDIVYCYLEIKNVRNIKTLEIKNEILFDVYPKQQNIIRTKINSKDKSFLLIPENNKAVLNFNKKHK